MRAVELLKYGIPGKRCCGGWMLDPLYEKWINSLSNPEEKVASIVKNIPLENRMTTAEEIANAVAFFLLSGKSSHTTGQLIHVDGGYVHLTARLPMHEQQ